MHPIVEKLLAISVGVTSLMACGHTRCTTGVREVPKTFAELGDRAPEVAAATYAELGLHGGSRKATPDECAAACGKGVSSCTVSVRFEGDERRPASSHGSVSCAFAGEEVCHDVSSPFGLGSCPFGCGRLPAFVEARLRRTAMEPVTLHFAEIALLEALSIGAFAELSRDLDRLGIRAFRTRIVRAQRDERRHARHARAILRRLGGRPERATRVPMQSRTLEEIALGNAVEGCVRETFGAVVATVQARDANDPLLRGFFVAIARDELRHAALAWDVHAVMMRRLRPAARARIERAQQAALLELYATGSPHADVHVRAGAPRRDARNALVRAMTSALPYAEAA